MMPKPFWNVLAVVVPLAAAIIGAIWASSIRHPMGDYGGRLAVGFILIFGVGAICLLGVGASITALVRGEAKPWLSVIGLVGNLAVVLPLLGVLLRK